MAEQSRNYAPPTGFVIDATPTTAALPPQAAPQAAPPQAAPPPDGFEPLANQPAPGTPQISDADISRNLQGMFDKGRPLREIEAYGQQFGRSWKDPTMRKTLSAYEQWRRRNPGAKPNIRVVPGEPQEPETTSFGAGARGFADGLSLDSADEISAFLGTVGNEVGTGLGLTDNDSGMSFGDRYNKRWDQEQELREADWRDHPWERGIGKTAGVGASLLIPIAGEANLAARGVQGARLAEEGVQGARAANFLTRIGQGVRTGAIYGGVDGFNSGSGDIGSRLESGGRGAVIGGATGGVFSAAAPTVVKGVTALAERSGLAPGASNALSGVTAFGRRFTGDPNALPARVAEARANNLNPTLADVIGPDGRSIVSTAAGRTPAATATARDFAAGRTADVQDRVGDQAQRIITPDDSRSAVDATAAVKEARDTGADETFSAVRADPLPVTPEIVSTLATGDGQSAIRRAIQLETDPATRAALGALGKFARGPQEAAVPAELAGLSPTARASAMAQLGIKAPEAPQFTVGMADKISRALNDGAEVAGRQGANARAGVLRGFGDSIRDVAKTNSQGYADALEAYSGASRSMAGVKVGADLVSPRTAPAEYQARVGETGTVAPSDAIPSARTMARVGARDAIETASGVGPTEALTAARRLATGNNPRANAKTLLGAEDAGRLQRGMAGEVERVQNANEIQPRVGGSVDRSAGEAINMIASLSSGKIGIARQVGQSISKLGLREVDADRLLTMATDPARVDEAVNYLIQRGANQNTARRILDATRSALARSAGSVAGQGQPRVTSQVDLPQ